MRKFKYALILVLFFVACSQNDTNTIYFPNGLKYSLLADEKQEKITQEHVDSFQVYFADPPFQIPLFRCLKGTEHVVYMALPINTTINDIKLYTAKSDSAVFLNEHEYYRLSEKDDKQMVEYAVEQNGGIVFMLIEANKKEKMNDELSLEAIQSRFQSNNKK